MDVASFFSGCGGLDLGFEQAGFNVVWANEFDSSIHETYRLNHPHTKLCTKDIRGVTADDIPDVDGFIGGPPCQAWSEAGKGLGLKDERGQVFLDYVRIIAAKRPKFFLIENVKGLLAPEHKEVFDSIISALTEAGYRVEYKLLDAVNYKIPQNRERIFIVGIRNDIKIDFKFPMPINESAITLRQAIGGDMENLPNQDVYIGVYSERYMSRNRVRSWDEPSFTIPATATNVPIHPQAPKMLRLGYDKWKFREGDIDKYRRLSIRECARIQSFPDSFRFVYTDIKDGYKMVGNAVPPRLGRALAMSIKQAFCLQKTRVIIGYIKSKQQKDAIERNLVYYIRRGNRIGALDASSLTPMPKVLILHDLINKYVYRIDNPEPVPCCAQQLINLGFSVNGNEYWVFKLSEMQDKTYQAISNKLEKLYKYPQIIEI